MIHDRYQNHVVIEHPLSEAPLLIGRVPKYLRFVYDPAKPAGQRWDALNELTDVAQPSEQIIVAVISQRSSVHIDRVVKRRRVGEWYALVVYKPIDEQPSDEVARDNTKWREWVESRESLSK